MKQNQMLPPRFVLVTFFLVCWVGLLFPPAWFAQTSLAQTAPEPQLSNRDAAAQQATAAATSFDQVVDRAIEREHFFMAHPAMLEFHGRTLKFHQRVRQY